ncbi:MAG: sterol desaturase family protein [Bacteroidota bacterium]
MDFNPVVLAIPIYFLLIGMELIYQQLRKVKLYRLNDATTNISCGITQQISGLFLKVLAIGLYQWIYQNFRIFTVEPTWYNLLILFVAADFLYYWAHRMSHEINLFWGGHVVHHQSEDYNLSVALRQSSLQVIWTFGFYLPLALVGFDTISFALMSGLVTVYQFWIHTETINKMGWLEHIFNTPSHHRVHHGRNPKYIDRNHAGVFIIWDKMFGTFQKEEEKPIYGITTPLKSWNPFWANIDHYVQIAKSLKKSSGIKNKLGILFNKPGWFPEEMGGYQKPPEVNTDSYQKYDNSASHKLIYYALLQYALAMIGTLLFLFHHSNMDMIWKLIIASILVLTITNCGGLFDRKLWVKWLEWIRLITIVLMYLIASFSTYILPYIHTVILTSISVSVIWFWFLQTEFSNHYLKSKILAE